MSEIETPPLQQHPKVWDPATLVLLVILCVFGAIIGVQLLVSLGVTPNTAIIPELRVTCSTFRIAAVVQKAGAIQNSADARQEYCS